MQRQIKYRAWNKQKREMHEWDISSLTNWLLYPEIYDVMEFTGLKDKNGTEIYEGDIIGPEDEMGIVKFGNFDSRDQSINGFYLEQPISECQFVGFKWSELEVIGNVWENPELLKV